MRADPSSLTPAPASEASAAQKLEAGQRLALASESEVSEPPPSAEVGVPPPSPVAPEGDATAKKREEEAEPEAPQKVEAATQVEVVPQKVEVVPQKEAAPQEPSRAVDLQAWQAKKIAASRVARSLQLLAYAVELLLLLLWLYFCYFWTSTLTLTLSDQTCNWDWKAFRCSAGCKPRMHLPGLQPSCTLK